MPIYMKFEGIEGPVTGKYKGWIELQSCQISVGGSGGGGAPSTSEIVVSKFLDSASTHLMREAISGAGKKVTIDFIQDGASAPYLSVELENTLISSYSTGGGDKPIETLSLNYTKITYTTKPTSASQNAQNAKDMAIWNAVVR